MSIDILHETARRLRLNVAPKLDLTVLGAYLERLPGGIGAHQ